MWVTNYGLTEWRHIYNSRQLLALATLCRLVRQVVVKLENDADTGYARAVASFMGLAVGRFADFNSSLCVFNNVGGRGVKNTFGRQALPLVWDYAESMPFNPQGANWEACIEAAMKTIPNLAMKEVAMVKRGSATSIPETEETFAAVVTDPPYYDAVPYSDLSDFFYVWHKRALADVLPTDFRTPVTPKRLEIIEERPHKSLTQRKDRGFYEENMALAFSEVRRLLHRGGVACVMFAHKTTTAWETLIGSLLRAGLIVTSSWPLHTERPGRLLSIGTASLASSVTLVCRKRTALLGDGLWDDVRQELKPVAKERLDFFWSQGIRGADFFISAIGPALSVFGKYERVTKLTGEEVTVGQFLDEVRSLVTTYALNKIMKTTHTATIDPESRFYVIWKWSYGEAKVPAGEAFTMAQALGMDTEIMWDRSGVLVKSGENVQAVPVAKRMKIKDLGEPSADTSPASMIDVLHRLCVFREKGDNEGMAEFLGRSGQGRNPNLWLVAQAVSEILPDGDKEKQLMQGLLNQRDQLEKAGAQMKLF
jgi:adenine-specific DNA methylase